MSEIDDKAQQSEQERRRWIFNGYAQKGVCVFLALSLIIFTVYLAGCMPDVGFSDKMLFLLLRLLRYASLLLCAFSLCALGFSVQRLVNYPKLRNVPGLFIYFTTGILGAAFAMLNLFIVIASEGNAFPGN